MASPLISRVVGIGASAGGVEAFSRLLTALRPDTGSAFVLLSHLSPTHRSELSRLFDPLTEMPVHDAVDGESVEPNHVYVLPANRTLTIADGRLHLATRDGGEKAPTGIDQFFQSLAVDMGAGAVGVILSGTGSDGTAGLEAIKARGGTTYAEDPVLAAYDGMPRNAIGSGVVDFVLPVEGIAEALGAGVGGGRRAGCPSLRRQDTRICPMMIPRHRYLFFLRQRRRHSRRSSRSSNVRRVWISITISGRVSRGGFSTGLTNLGSVTSSPICRSSSASRGK